MNNGLSSITGAAGGGGYSDPRFLPPQQGSKAAATDESASRIRDAVGYTESVIEQLANVIERLERRLDTVLTPTNPSGNETEKAGLSPVASHLCGRIGQVNTNLELCITRLHLIVQRIEI